MGWEVEHIEATDECAPAAGEALCSKNFDAPGLKTIDGIADIRQFRQQGNS